MCHDGCLASHLIRAIADGAASGRSTGGPYVWPMAQGRLDAASDCATTECSNNSILMQPAPSQPVQWSLDHVQIDNLKIDMHGSAQP